MSHLTRRVNTGNRLSPSPRIQRLAPTLDNFLLLPSRQKNTYFRSGSKAIAKTGSAKKLEYKYLAVLGHSEKIKIKAD